MSSLEIDPGACWIRHIRRARIGEQGAVSVLAATFVSEPLTGVNGRHGWQSAQPEVRLSDDGSFSVVFPNAAGDDGRLHRERFAILSDPLYRPGEEWLEFRREPDDLIMVGTPTRARLDRGELVLEGLDGMRVLHRATSSEVDAWIGAAPLDVLRFYAGVPVMHFATNFVGIDGSYSWGGSNPWQIGLEGGPSPEGDGVLLADDGVAPYANLVRPLPAIAGDDWILEMRSRHRSGDLRIVVSTAGNPGVLELVSSHATAAAAVSGMYELTKPVVKYALPSLVTHRLIKRGEWLYIYVNGELVSHGRLSPAAALKPTNLRLEARNANVVVQEVRYLTVEPLLMRERPADTRLPSAPTPGGLRARYYLEGDARSVSSAAEFRLHALSPFLEPYAERLEAPNFNGANPPAWQPAGPPNGEAFSVRWTGAIYLDLETSERTLNFGMGGDLLGRGRVWIGGILMLDYSDADAGAPKIASMQLRQHLGQRKGWWPILCEYSHLTGAGGFALNDVANGTGVGATAVPASRLSPLGTVDREVRNEAHRETFGEVAESFGYQWRLEPRPLESGTFPGVLELGARVGRDTALVIDSLEAFDIATEVDASEAIDGIVADASGLAGAEENAQLSHEIYSATAAAAHLTYSTAYESLAEISEESHLRARAGSMLALRSVPAETIGVRSKGTRELVDRFPLPAIPELARMLWRPGDGVRLALDELATRDETPRQLTVVQWPLRPDGATPPVVSYRQRGRGMRAGLERLRQQVLAPRRTFQGQLTQVSGSIGQVGDAGAGVDAYSRLSLPNDFRRVVRLELVVLSKSDASAWTIEYNGASTGVTAPRANRYDITPFAQRYSGVNPYAFLRLTGGTGTYNIVAVATVRI